MAEQKILDRFKNGNGPIRNFFKSSLSKDTLETEQNKLAVGFATGLQQSLELPTGSIDTTALKDWLLSTMRSFVKPEHWSETIEPTEIQMQEFGKQLGQLLTNAAVTPEQIVEEPIQETTEIESPQKLLDRARSLIAIDR